MEEVVVRRVRDPALDGNRIVCPSSVLRFLKCSSRLTFVKNVAHRAIVQDHDLAQVRLDLRQVLDVRAVAVRAVLPVVAAREVGALALEPVDDRVGVLLHRGGEDDEVEPFADLGLLAGVGEEETDDIPCAGTRGSGVAHVRSTGWAPGARSPSRRPRLASGT